MPFRGNGGRTKYQYMAMAMRRHHNCTLLGVLEVSLSVLLQAMMGCSTLLSAITWLGAFARAQSTYDANDTALQPPGVTIPLVKKCGPTSANVVCIHDYSAVMPYHFFREGSNSNASVGPLYRGTMVPSDPSFEMVAHADFAVFDEERAWDILGDNPTYDFMFVPSVFVPDLNKLYLSTLGRPTGTLPQLVVDLDADPPTLSEYLSDPPVYAPNGGTSGRNNSIGGTEQKPSIRTLDSKTNKTVTLLNNYYGYHFNCVDDLIVNHKDGSVWFTDPLYSWWQRLVDTPPQLRAATYRFDPKTGEVRVVEDSLGQPNGIDLSPDGKHMYISDTDAFRGSILQDGPPLNPWNQSGYRTAYKFDVTEDGLSLTNKRPIYYSPYGVPDGVKVAANGLVATATDKGVDVLDENGSLILRVQTNPEFCVDWTKSDGDVDGRKQRYCAREMESHGTRLSSNGIQRHDEGHESESQGEVIWACTESIAGAACPFGSRDLFALSTYTPALPYIDYHITRWKLILSSKEVFDHRHESRSRSNTHEYQAPRNLNNHHPSENYHSYYGENQHKIMAPTHKSKKKKKKEQLQSLKSGRPPPSQTSIPKTLSSKTTQATIVKFHHLNKSLATAISSNNTHAIKTIEREIQNLGGLKAYQEASILGQSKPRGGDSSIVLIDWLLATTTTKSMKILEIGAVSTKTAISKPGLFQEIVRIDLNPRGPGILKQDFMQRAFDEFSILSLSLVLNFVPTPRGRGEMLARTTKFLEKRGGQEKEGGGMLFLVLPAPCVLNSRYFDDERLEKIMGSLGYVLVKRKGSRKLVYWLWELRREPKMGEVFGKVKVRDGPGMNNFYIELRPAPTGKEEM
ncbi:hypothetical protein AC579_8107 [Pseudocercospora musae]|uniref:25S rRNA adenine-N(1) methyltransferase n=1 Tax=Pseudocercospora musae TaxID=113226 RepID=A0A139IG36_9PEZI|nr:hypothetical protein AC579_8107 [Pseudocercospora musae]